MTKTLSDDQQAELLGILQARFAKHTERHKAIAWADVQTALQAQPSKLWSLQQMEETGGEPDVVDYKTSGHDYVFMDCSVQSPSGRRSVCYDHAALEARKKFPPKDSAVNMAKIMGVELLDEAAYRWLQTRGEFDTTTSSWIATPAAIRKHGGALFGDCRYKAVFVYHNGADSYYAARGFRALLVV